MKTNKNFEQLLNTPCVKFTVILGSGFHIQALGSNSILSNWEKLLKKQDSDLNLTGFYPLDFEQLVVRRTGNQKAEKSGEKATYEVEKRISDEICFDLKYGFCRIYFENISFGQTNNYVQASLFP